MSHGGARPPDQGLARIVVSTVGIRGDLNPFIGLGRGLRTRGHTVVFAVESTMAGALQDEGFETHQIAGDILGALTPHIGSVVGGRTALAAVRPIVRDWLTRDLSRKVMDLEAACEGADLLVARAANLAAPIAAERLRLPWVQVTMTALTVPSAHNNPWLPSVPAGRLGRRAAWAAMELFIRRLADGPVNKVRSELGLPLVRNVMSRGGHSRNLTAVAVSPELSPRQPDWPDYVRTTGYCFWDVPTRWREPPELTEFLSGGGPTVAVSFGSMAPFVGSALDHMYSIAIDAVRASQVKVLVLGCMRPHEHDVLTLPFAPFSQVYPRCTAAIHHAGAYTVGEALRAGIPSLAVPWGIDQFFTAGELVRTGAGRATHHRRFDRRRAGRDVEALLNHAPLRKSAEALAARLASEDGVGRLCGELEHVLESGAPPRQS